MRFSAHLSIGVKRARSWPSPACPDCEVRPGVHRMSLHVEASALSEAFARIRRAQMTKAVAKRPLAVLAQRQRGIRR